MWVQLATAALGISAALAELTQALLESETSGKIHTASHCKNIPGDAGWPQVQAWSKLNRTVNGGLIATVPMGSVCHDPTYDEAKCKELTEHWGLAQLEYVFWHHNSYHASNTKLFTAFHDLQNSCLCIFKTTAAHHSHPDPKNATWGTMHRIRSMFNQLTILGQVLILRENIIFVL